MIVTVIDRRAQDFDWGHGLSNINRYLRNVEIADNCPRCGNPRGIPTWSRLCEEGEWYSVSNWDNPCGHLDMYSDVLKEAEFIERYLAQAVGSPTAASKGRQDRQPKEEIGT